MLVHCIARNTSIKPGLAWEVNLVIGGPITYLGLSFTSNRVRFFSKRCDVFLCGSLV
jgi:hypothetical protein